MPYKLKGDDLCKWVSESDTHSGAPVPQEVGSEPTDPGSQAPQKPEGAA